MMDKQYYENRKQEIQLEYNKLVFETYEEIQRLVVKKITKERELQAKIQELEAKEKAEAKPAPEAPAPAKNEKTPAKVSK
jgi:BMFP domain-containing protein YqiC